MLRVANLLLLEPVTHEFSTSSRGPRGFLATGPLAWAILHHEGADRR
jgi:hypothetical protein